VTTEDRSLPYRVVVAVGDPRNSNIEAVKECDDKKAAALAVAEALMRDDWFTITIVRRMT
jgi:hypothetical protein